MSLITIVLALIPMGLMLGLLPILVRRKLYRRFPVFCFYCIWTLIVGVVRFLVLKHPLAYFLAYWLTEASYFVIALIAMLLVAGPYIEAVEQRSRLIMGGALGLVVTISMLMAVMKPVGNKILMGRFASGIYVFVALMCLLEVTIFVYFLVIRSRYPFGWSVYEMSILTGFGVLALLTFVADLRTLLPIFHIAVAPLFEQVFQYFPAGASPASIIAWIVAFWRPEPPLPPYDPPDLRKYQKLAQVLEESTETLKELRRRLGLRLEIVFTRWMAQQTSVPKAPF